MYICDECGMITEELQECVEYHPCGSTVAEERYLKDECACGGMFVEANECPECGELYPYYDGFEDCCPKCVETARGKIRLFMQRHSEEMQQCIAELINDGDY